MPERYHVVSNQDSPSTLDSSALAEVLAKDGQLLLPVLDLIENAQVAIDDLIDVMGRATIEAVLLMSAAQLAGPKQQGKKSDRDVVYHGSQKGRVALSERELKVEKPRLRKKTPNPGEPGEVEIPAYQAMRENDRLTGRMLEILIAGVSTRRYEQVILEMAETVGVSKSQVSRETIEAGERLLKSLAERDFSKLDILAVWIDGIQLGSYHVICAVGVDVEGLNGLALDGGRLRRDRPRLPENHRLQASLDAQSGPRRVIQRPIPCRTGQGRITSIQARAATATFH